MTKILKIFALLSVFHSVLPAQISVIAPPIFHRNKPFNVGMSVSRVRVGTDLAVIFRDRNAGFKISPSQTSTTSNLISFQQNNSIPTTRGKVAAPTLKFLARQNGLCVSKEVDIFQTPNTKHVFIQLDRPTYMPGEEVKFRVIAFDDDTKPINLNAIEVKIVNSVGQEVMFLDEFENDQQELFKRFGLYENIFTLDEDTFEGDWKISAFIDGDDKLSAEKYFTVSKKEIPLYDFIVKIPEVVVVSDGDFPVEIAARYRFGSYAKGTLKISFVSVSSGTELFNTGNFPLYTAFKKNFRISEDLKLNYILSDSYDLNVTFTFTADIDKTFQSVTKRLKVLSKRTHSIILFEPHVYQPGFRYVIQATVKDPLGHLVTRSADNVKLYATYYNSRGSIVHKQTLSRAIRDSVVEFVLITTSDVTKIIYEASFLNAKEKKTVTTQSAVPPSLRVFIDNEPLVGQDAIIRVEAPKVITGVTVFVFSGSGIVYHQHFDKMNRYSIQFSIKTLKTMLPQAKIVAYAVDGAKVYFGSAKLTFNKFGDNFLNVVVPNSENSFNNIVKKNINITYTTKPNSLISLLAIDKSQTFDKNGHDIYFSDVLETLTNQQYLYDSAVAYNNITDVFYDRNNRNYLLNLDFTNRRACTAAETEMLDRINNVIHVVQSSGGVNYYKTQSSLPKEFDVTDPASEKLRSDFLDTWIWQTELSESGNGLIQEIVPDSLTTWLFSGFSIHPEYGFALTQPQELIVSKSFFVELNLPYSIRIGEVLSLDILVFNFLPQNIPANLNVYALDEEGNQQFDFMTLSDQSRCLFTKVSQNVYTNNIQAAFYTGTSHRIYISPRKNSTITIRVSATTSFFGKTYEDYIAKTIVVENEGIADYDTRVALLRPSLNKNDVKTFTFSTEDVNPDSIEMKAVVSGNFMGGAVSMDQLGYIYSSHCGEQKLSIATKNVFIYKYLNITGGPQAVLTNTRNSIRTGYSLTLAHRNPVDGGFRYYPRVYYQSSTWLTAYAARLFGEMMRLEITPVDKKIIEDALDLVAKRQNTNGKFEMIDYYYYSLYDTPISKDVLYTCNALLGFVTNHGFVEKDYTTVIDKAFDFVSKNSASINNYAASVCAYAAAIYDPTLEKLNITKGFLDRLNDLSYTDGIYRYWDDKKWINSGFCNRIIISSYVALTHIKLKQYSEAKPIINWLLKQRQANGEFCYTFPSSVGFEALSEYAIYFGVEDTDMEVKVETEAKKPQTTRVNKSNAKDAQVLRMPDNNHNVTVTGSGYGFAQVQLHYSYTRMVEQLSNFFVMNVYTSISTISTVRVCVRLAKINSGSDMIMIELNLPSGFTYQAEMTNPMKQSALVQDVDIKNGGTTVYLYVQKLFTFDVCFDLYASKTYQVDKLKKGSVKTYVYGNKETVVSRFFNLETGKCAA